VVSDGAIETLVSQVRRKLGKEYIKTYYRQGYEFMG
jgi:DNA-binding winged helix-turn-helix (wHTH) protein